MKKAGLSAIDRFLGAVLGLLKGVFGGGRSAHCHDAFEPAAKWLAGSQLAPNFLVGGRAAVWLAPSELRHRFYQGLDSMRQMRSAAGAMRPQSPGRKSSPWVYKVRKRGRSEGSTGSTHTSDVQKAIFSIPKRCASSRSASSSRCSKKVAAISARRRGNWNAPEHPEPDHAGTQDRCGRVARRHQASATQRASGYAGAKQAR